MARDGDDLSVLRDAALDEGIVIDPFEQYVDREIQDDRMFGMTASERMFVSIGCFLLTSLGGFLLLLLMEKIVI
ncbi:MAG: hypothetical protein JW966_14515 [Anaerolineae bacterium]|nr:hypothetical protein [Anaerolineae bacterium]